MTVASQLIAIVGPESCGKTELAETLARAFGAPWLPEYAREYLTGRADYDEADLAIIAREQFAREAALASKAVPLTIFDTDAIVIEVWWRERFGSVPDWVLGHIAAQPPRHYLLTHPDIPWRPDPLREAPVDRERLFEIYVETLTRHGLTFHEVTGAGDERVQLAINLVKRLSS